MLHEEFSQRSEKIRVDRLSRHLYDLERLMDTEYGKAALQDKVLYESIVTHREKFNAIKGLDYSQHKPDKISILSPETVRTQYQKDYRQMTEFMIYGETQSYERLIERLKQL